VWTQEGGLTLFQHTTIELCKGLMPHFGNMIEEDDISDMAVKQARSLIRAMADAEADGELRD
jgi:hypothetical protein